MAGPVRTSGRPKVGTRNLHTLYRATCEQESAGWFSTTQANGLGRGQGRLGPRTWLGTQDDYVLLPAWCSPKIFAQLASGSEWGLLVHPERAEHLKCPLEVEWSAAAVASEERGHRVGSEWQHNSWSASFATTKCAGQRTLARVQPPCSRLVGLAEGQLTKSKPGSPRRWQMVRPRTHSPCILHQKMQLLAQREGHSMTSRPDTAPLTPTCRARRWWWRPLPGKWTPPQLVWTPGEGHSTVSKPCTAPRDRLELSWRASGADDVSRTLTAVFSESLSVFGSSSGPSVYLTRLSGFGFPDALVRKQMRSDEIPLRHRAQDGITVMGVSNCKRLIATRDSSLRCAQTAQTNVATRYEELPRRNARADSRKTFRG